MLRSLRIALFYMTDRHNARRRIQRPARLLKSLRLLRIRAERMSARAESIEEKSWCRSLIDALDALIQTGDAALPPLNDPRDVRRVRKRPTAGSLL
jgi:hypothetical protein